MTSEFEAGEFGSGDKGFIELKRNPFGPMKPQKRHSKKHTKFLNTDVACKPLSKPRKFMSESNPTNFVTLVSTLIGSKETTFFLEDSLASRYFSRKRKKLSSSLVTSS